MGFLFFILMISISKESNQNQSNQTLQSLSFRFIFIRYLDLLSKPKMKHLILSSFLHEVETWKRLLDFMQTENVHMKNQLAQFLNQPISSNLLEEIENYQNVFITEDKFIALFKHDLVKQLAEIKNELSSKKVILDITIQQHKKTRREIGLGEQQFSKLKYEFNSYLTDKLLN